VKIVRASFEIVTPAFIAGADQTKAELRIPSLRGVLRFWWRALVYARYQGDLDEIRKREAWLFGSTDRQSGVIVSFEGEPRVRVLNQRTWNNDDWQFYTGYGLVESTGGVEREFLAPGGSFTLRVLLHHRLGETDVAELVDAFRLFGLAGGIGGRTRKAWGSICATGIETPGSSTWTAPTNRDSYLREVSALLRPSASWLALPTYSALWSESRVAVGARQRNGEAAHRALVKDYKDYLKIDGAGEEGIDKLDRESFGLPRTTRPPLDNGGERRASTVFLHVHSLGDAGALPVALFLPAVFLPGIQDEPTTGWDAAHGLLDRIEAAS
jgi:CRISPR-associated protein Cmr1